MPARHRVPVIVYLCRFGLVAEFLRELMEFGSRGNAGRLWEDHVFFGFRRDLAGGRVAGSAAQRMALVVRTSKRVCFRFEVSASSTRVNVLVIQALVLSGVVLDNLRRGSLNVQIRFLPCLPIPCTSL